MAKDPAKEFIATDQTRKMKYFSVRRQFSKLVAGS